MKKLFLQVCIFLGLVLVVQLFRLPYGSYKTKLLPILREATQRRGIMGVDASAIDLRFPAHLEIKDLSLILAAGRVPLPVFVDSAWVALKILPLFILQGKVQGEINLYQGKLSLNAQRGLMGGALDSTFQLQGLQLEAHPLLKGVGLHGAMDALVELKVVPPSKVAAAAENAKITITISKGLFDGGALPVQSLPIQLPRVENIGVSAKAVVAKKHLDLQSFVLTSSIASIDAKGGYDLVPGAQPQQGSLSATIELSEEGKATIGSYLALAAGKSIETPPSAYQAELEFSSGRLSKFQLSPL